MRALSLCESFSKGALANFKTDCFWRQELVEATVRDLTAAVPVAGLDKTSVRANSADILCTRFRRAC